MSFTKDEAMELKIGVLMGGISSEREVSLNSGKAVFGALADLGYDVVSIDAREDLPHQLRYHNIDIAWLALHGKWGEDGSVQGLLEYMGIPYTGSGVLASAMAMNKPVARRMFQEAGLDVAEGVVESVGKLQDAGVSALPFDLPVVVKPAAEGSSVGVSIAKSEDEFAHAIAEVAKYDEYALVERFVAGREIHVGILNNKALGAIEIVPAEEFYNYAAKYTAGTTRYIYPAPVEKELYERLLDVGLRAHLALGCSGGTRVDTIVSEDGTIYVLELNSLPGMTSTSLLPKIAQGVGIEFAQLCELILLDASLKNGTHGG